MPQGPRGDVAAVEVQQVEDHEERWRRDGRGVGLAQPLEARPQLLVVDHDLAVEHERAGGQLGDRGGQISEAPRVVASVAAHQADALAVLVRQPYGVFTLLQIATPRNSGCPGVFGSGIHAVVPINVSPSNLMKRT